ncbi:hypothetical protein ES703_65193 [subsurface metagenome]
MIIKDSRGLRLPVSLACLIRIAIFWLSCCCQAPILARKGGGGPGTGEIFCGLSFEINGFCAFAESVPTRSEKSIMLTVTNLAMFPSKPHNHLYRMNLAIIVGFFRVFHDTITDLKTWPTFHLHRLVLAKGHPRIIAWVILRYYELLECRARLNVARNQEFINEFASGKGCGEITHILYLERFSLNSDEGEIPIVGQVGKGLPLYGFYLRAFQLIVVVLVIIANYHAAEEFVKDPLHTYTRKALVIKDDCQGILNKDVGMGKG